MSLDIKVDESISESLEKQMNQELKRIEEKKNSNKDLESSNELRESKKVVSDKQEEPDEYTEKALKMGWDPKGKKSAQRFVEDKSFFDRIEAKNKKIDELSDVVKNLIDHNTKVEKAAYDKALRDLQLAKEEAVSNADMERYKAIEKEQAHVYKQIQEVDKHAESLKVKPSEPEQPIMSEALLKFKEENKDWLNHDTPENSDMVEDADYINKRIGKQLQRQGKTVSEEEYLNMVVDALKKQYPHRFKNEKRESGKSSVDSSTVGKSEGKENLASKLTKQQKEFVRKAKMYNPKSKLTEESYARQLKLTGDLRDE